MLTIFTEIEVTVNNQPLTYVSDNSDDLEPLTLNHLLLGRYNSDAVIEENDGDISSRRRWKQAVVTSNQFWKRWLIEYLPTLQSRRKSNKHWTKDYSTFKGRGFTKRKITPCSNHWRLSFIRQDCTSSKSKDDDWRIRSTIRNNLLSGMWPTGVFPSGVLETVSLRLQFITF